MTKLFLVSLRINLSKINNHKRCIFDRDQSNLIITPRALFFCHIPVKLLMKVDGITNSFEIFQDGARSPFGSTGSRSIRSRKPHSRTKHEVDRMTRCGDIATCRHLNFPRWRGPAYIHRVKQSFVIFDIRTLWRVAQDWASECPDVKNYKWLLNPVWHTTVYMATVGVKGFNSSTFK